MVIRMLLFGKKTWHAKVPGKVKICVWRAINNILPTRDKLMSKGYMGDMHCLACNHHTENTVHLFCFCPIMQQVLMLSGLSLPLHDGLSFKDWLLHAALQLKAWMFDKLLVLIWSVWKNQNDLLWQGKSQNAQSIMLEATTWLQEYQRVHKPEKLSGHSVRKRWSRPSGEHVYKINVDAAFLPNQTRGGVGGVVRDASGRFVAGFAKPIAYAASPKQSELLAIREGFDLLLSLNLQNVIIESDSMEATKAQASYYDLLANGGISMTSREHGISFQMCSCSIVLDRVIQ